LAAAHERGIVHRDLKPENVMRSRTGRVKILDFGLARFAEAGADATSGTSSQQGALAGTPAYMSPEQLNGRVADARSDVFQLGMLVYEYACGAHPFAAGTRMATCARILEATPDPIITRRPDLGAVLASSVDRCLQKLPAERFGSAAEIVGALSLDAPAVRMRAPAAWWRVHQLLVIALYVGACVMGWEVKESRHGVSTAVFLALGALATIGGVLRGHVLFTERVNRTFFRREWQKAAPVLLGIDFGIAVMLTVDGVLIAAGGKPLFAVFTVALGLGVALARAILEPATTQSTFPDVVTHARH
jgi:hypothetical protein